MLAFLRLVIVSVLALIMVGWVAIDADRRGRNPLAWAAFVALFGIFALPVWLLARRRTPAAPQPAGFLRRAGLVLMAVPLLALSMVVVVFTVTFLVQVARIEGRAMSPTLEDQDRVIVNKLTYQLRVPRRDDVVMLYYPLNPDKKFVKRVVAEEGDQVRLVDGQVYLNDVPLSEPFVTTDARSHDDWGPQVVPEGYYFVMGDRRNNSSDSRHWGFVPKKYILGRVQCRWWPVGNARCF